MSVKERNQSSAKAMTEETQSELEGEIRLATLGFMVWWSITDTSVARQTVVDVMLRHGFDENVVPDITAKKALGRAISALTQEQKNWIIRSIKADDDVIMYACAEQGVDEVNEELSFRPTGHITLQKDSLELGIDGEVPDTIFQYYERALNFLFASDLQSMCLRVVQSLQSLPMRKAGGIYFVPSPHLAELDLLEEALEEIDPLQELLAFPQLDVGKAKNNLKSVVELEFGEMIKDLKKKLTETAKGTEIGLLSDRALNTRLTQYQETLDQGLVYESLLGMRLASARGQLKELMEEVGRLAGAQVTCEELDLTPVDESAAAM